MLMNVRSRRAALFASVSTSAVLLMAALMPQNIQPAVAAPNFQAPFYCGQTWIGSTRTNHNPLYAVDFNFYPQPDEIGKKIRASANGTVIYAQYDTTTGYGRTVKLRHGSSGYMTLYAHLSSISVNVGDTVTQGQPIGVVGESGSGAESVHLHYEQRYNGNDVRVVLNGRQVVYYDSWQEITSRNC